jgi:hypothetical protein
VKLTPAQAAVLGGHTGFVVVLAGGLPASERAGMTRIR